MDKNNTPSAQPNISILDFHIRKGLKQCADSMLFDSDTVIADMKVKTSDDLTVSVALMVRGYVSVTYRGMTYHKPSEFPQELRELIASRFSEPPFVADMTDESIDAAMEVFGSVEQEQEYDYCIILSNWFEYIWHITDADGDAVAHDGILCDDNLNTMTEEQLRSEMEKVVHQVLELV